MKMGYRKERALAYFTLEPAALNDTTQANLFIRSDVQP